MATSVMPFLADHSPIGLATCQLLIVVRYMLGRRSLVSAVAPAPVFSQGVPACFM